MTFIVSYEEKVYAPASEGLHQAVCVDVIDLGMQETPWGAKQKCRISWQIEEINSDTNKRLVVSKSYTVSLHKKASLRKDLETWRGRKFTQEELDGFDLEKLVGINSQIQVVHNITDEGRVYGNVQAVVPVGKGMTRLRAQDFVRQKDRPTEQKPSNVRPIAAAGGRAATEYDDDVPF